MNKTEMQQVLDALESNAEYAEAEYAERREFWGENLPYRWEALKASAEQAKVALAIMQAAVDAPDAEPVGYVYTERHYRTPCMAEVDTSWHGAINVKGLPNGTPLYIAPQERKPLTDNAN